ncbi:hypothetical protein ABPG74_021616 [Tetrahymena malaccensis]
MSEQVKEINTAAAANAETLSQGSAEGSAASTSNSEIPNPKYKTALCRNYLNSQCNRNSGCHFAHGSEELRAVSENSNFFAEVEKSNTDYLSKWPSNIPTNYKTTLCKFYEQVGTCKYDQNCNFAHGDHEKRNIPETIQSQLKNARNSHKHINNSAGHRNQQQLAMQQYMIGTQYFQQYFMQYVLSQQQNTILEMCDKILADSKDEYTKKIIEDIQKLVEQQKIKQALSQLKNLCSKKDASNMKKEILKDVEKYLQSL